MKPKYKIIKCLREDSCSKSYLASVDNEEKKYIIKQIIIQDMTDNEKKETLNEAAILKKLDHPNIIKFKEVFIQRKPFEALNLVTEYADDGDLEQKIKEQKNKPFTETEILDYFTQVCLALQYLHKKKIIHRNIKSNNIFLMKSGIVKLGIFHISKSLKRVEKKMAQSIYYLPPEILSNKPYNVKSDIWALGILLYELLTFKMPFNDQSLPKLSIKINKGEYAPPSSEYSSEIRDLLKKCLTTNPDIRPSIDEILNLPLIKNRINNKLNEVQYEQDLSTIMIKKYKDKKKEGKEVLHQDKTAKEPDKKENPEKKIMNDKNKLAKHFKIIKAGSTNISTPISLSKINFLMKRKDPNFQKDKKYKEEEIGKILDARGYKDLLDDKSGNFDINKMSEKQYDQLRLLNILYKVANGQEQDSNGDEGASKEIIEQYKEENNEDKIKKEIEKEIGNDLLKEIFGIIEKTCGENNILDKELIKKNILELTSKGFDKTKVEKTVDKIEELNEILMKNKINT